MLKKLTACILSLGLLSSPCLAATSDAEVMLLDSLGIFEGYEDGSYRLENSLTRGEFTKVSVMASKARKSVWSALSTSPFADVPHTLWSAPYIRLAAEEGYVNGYLDSTFRPDETITFAEATAVFLRLLGYTNSDFGASWPSGHMAIAADIELTKGISLAPDTPITRGDTVTLLCNLLDENLKGTNTKYLSVLDCTSQENVIIRATNAEDSTVGKDKVLTSAGTYYKGKNFSPSWVGRTGELYLENVDTVKAFVPDDETNVRMETYVVYSTLQDGIITYQGGKMEKVPLEDGLPLYKGNSAAGTFLKSQLKMGDILKVVYDEENDADYVIRDTDGLKGPFTADAAWQTTLGTNANTSYLRDGEPVSASAIETYDILYYSEGLNMVLAYTDTVTGVYKAASPSKDAPSSVTVSGKSYAIESVTAFQKLGAGGTFSFGDTVTLLLGRTGAVADVITSSSAGTLAGFVTETGTKSFETSLGAAYTGYYITLMQADGQTLELEADKDYDNYLNQVVSLTFSGGKATANGKKAPDIRGTFDAAAMVLGEHTLSPDVKILDTYAPDAYKKGTALSVYPQRLDGVTLSSAQVLYASLDSRGRISELILNDVTGDIHSYGVVTKATSVSQGMHLSGSYEYAIGDKIGTYAVNGTAFSVGSHTPAKFTYIGGQVYSITPLSELSGTVSAFSGDTIMYKDGSRYDSSEASVYLRKSGNTYTLLQSDAVSLDAYTLTAYYDRSISAGGKVRVIIATEK